MKYRSLVIVPARGRASRIADTITALLSQSTTSDIVVAVDSDEAHLYFRHPGVEYNIGSADGMFGMNPKFNAVAVRKMMEYDFISFIADDVVPITQGWDELLIDAIADVPMGISYPDDGIQGSRLPSNGTCFDSRIVRALGFISPAELPHLYCDNCWRDMGNGMQSLRYCGNVKVNHKHYSIGKSEWDDTYALANQPSIIRESRAAYKRWVQYDLPNTLTVLNNYMGNQNAH